MTRLDPDQYDYPNSAYQAACDKIAVMRAALESIARNTCCDTCREAALVAQRALSAATASPECFGVPQDAPILTSNGHSDAEPSGALASALARVDLLESALTAAIEVADEARDEWDAAPQGMRAGKLLIALSGRLPGYRDSIDAIHAALGLSDLAAQPTTAAPATDEPSLSTPHLPTGEGG